MKALINKLSLLLIALTLTSCGGGGGSGGAFQPPPPIPQLSSLTVAASKTAISTNNFVDISITAKKSDGSLATDGTSVSAVLTPASIGIISSGATAGGSTASGTTIGGIVAFRFSSGVNDGTAHLVFSATSSSGGAATAAFDIAVGSGTTDNRLILTPSSITLPVNPSPGAFPFLGSPYLGEVTITRRGQNGQLITGTEKDNTSIAPVQIAAFSTLDDPSTPWTGADKKPPTAEGNEFLTEIGSGPVSVTGGQGSIFVHAQNTPGTATLFVTALDTESGQTISAKLTVNVVSTVPPLPASITLSAQSNSVYTSVSGGNSSSTINALVLTGAGVPVPNPTVGNTAYNNIQFDIVGPNPGGASLSVIGTTNSSSVKTHTTAGIASVQFNAGAQTGAIQIKATVDRADNNVENPGIQDPVSSTITVNVSDGKLYSLAISSPVVNGLSVNSISAQTTSSSATPADPNATYSVTESALATDRAGNPVLPGTVINFGLIDAPASNKINFGDTNFLITGKFGDPKENGTLFTATDGHFMTAGGGAGPGDTLLLFGHSTTFDNYVAPVGNRDLESSRTIASVQTDQSLTVTASFNPNDDTGVSVDNGAVIPYVIGHATSGNITASATTNARGVATAFMTYAASHIGQYAYVWAQGNVTTATGTKTVADIAASGYPGVAPAALSAPSTIVGNTVTTLRVCIADALSQPISQQTVAFQFENIGSGTAVIDGNPSGIFQNPTDASGCSTGVVTTTGLTNAGTAKPDVVISADGQKVTVTISVGGAPILQASPSSLLTGGSIVLTLTDDHGNPIQNVAINAACAQGASSSAVLPTGTAGAAPGTSPAQITSIGLDAAKTPKTATCTFTAANGAIATVTVTGRDICPSNPAATGCDVPPSVKLTVNLQNAGPAGRVVAANVTVSGFYLGQPVASGCSIAGTASSSSCDFSFDKGQTITLKAIPTGAHTAFFGWAGTCGTTSGNTTQLAATADSTCTANFTCNSTTSCP